MERNGEGDEEGLQCSPRGKGQGTAVGRVWRDRGEGGHESGFGIWTRKTGTLSFLPQKAGTRQRGRAQPSSFPTKLRKDSLVVRAAGPEQELWALLPAP